MPGQAPMFNDERSGLLTFLHQMRHVLRIAAYGLTDEQARATPSASSLSVGGLVKHCASVERRWMSIILQTPQTGHVDDYVASFTLQPDETLAWALDDYAEAARETTAVIDGVADLDQSVPVPKDVPWFPKDLDAWSVRWVLLHLIHETARHAGHADIVRETVDGATAFPLMAAAEGWTATPWMKPWQPPSA